MHRLAPSYVEHRGEPRTKVSAPARLFHGTNLALFVTTYNGTQDETRRSLDGGNTGTLLPSALPNDGRTWFDPAERRLLRRCAIEGQPIYE